MKTDFLEYVKQMPEHRVDSQVLHAFVLLYQEIEVLKAQVMVLEKELKDFRRDIKSELQD